MRGFDPRDPGSNLGGAAYFFYTLIRTIKIHNKPRGVVVSMRGSESRDPSSSLGGAVFYSRSSFTKTL